MNSQQQETVAQCVALSEAGQIHFGEVVRRLIEAGIERYHADYSRSENTYYTPEGSSCVVPMSVRHGPIADRFDPEGVRSSIRRAQRGEILYPAFVEETTRAGCVGYFVQITGRRVRYFGRRGEEHTEWFPGAGPVAAD